DERTMFLRIDLSSLAEGDHTILLTEDMVEGKPPGAEITDISPEKLEISIELNVLRSQIPISPSLLGKPSEGYDIHDSYCIPRNVSIQGPKSIVEKIEIVTTSPVRLEGLTSSLVQRNLALISPGRRVKMSLQAVDLRVDIGEKYISKDFNRIPVTAKGTIYESKINPKTIGVRVKGPLTQINRLKRENLQVVLLLNGNEALQQNLRLENLQIECTPHDSFPDVELERLSQSFVDLWLTMNIISP
ncbi:CdaR family protein, partial [Gemmatimonadota bacterium]